MGGTFFEQIIKRTAWRCLSLIALAQCKCAVFQTRSYSDQAVRCYLRVQCCGRKHYRKPWLLKPDHNVWQYWDDYAYICMHEYICDQLLTCSMGNWKVLVISVSSRLFLLPKQAETPFFLIFPPNYLGENFTLSIIIKGCGSESEN